MNAEIAMYRAENGVRVITFSGSLTGMLCAWENTPEWDNAFSLAHALNVEIERAYGYDGSVAK